MTNITAIIIILCVFSVLGLISYFVYEHLTRINVKDNTGFYISGDQRFEKIFGGRKNK